MVSMRSKKPICAPPRLSEVSPTISSHAYFTADVHPLRDSADVELTIRTPASFDPAEAFVKRFSWFGKWDKTDPLATLGVPAVRVAQSPHTSPDWHFEAKM